ncbi:class I SAM-dependent methyltransferase [Gudongella sp. DL1XJH-153]|uniref:class I SAM-dependent methyltransferase n=1 Tax=Gudongella sp. DL1XJH-153 TaxID=3409804 RepID=UPI003BB4EDEC
METRELLKKLIIEDKLSKAVLSNRRTRDDSLASKVIVSPVTIKDRIMYQFESHIDNKALHENLEKEEALDRLLELIQNDFRQAVMKTSIGEYQILTSKKGKQKIIGNMDNISKVVSSHNRKKQYVISEGEPVDFLIHLGVMDGKGKVFKQKYNKFRQINKFLELVDASMEPLMGQDEIRIIDFGCGKSYLTFALHHYLVKIKNKKVKITGLDLKQDVIDLCNRTTEELNYEGLQFICGDIKDHSSGEDIDMVVTLHACDTATDVALEKAVRWGAKVILSVPCCQHELYDKIKNNNLSAMLKHGIIRERLSSLVTDSIRGSVLEILGYQVQLLEFIDMEHTPKNIMIRAIKKHPIFREEKVKEYRELKETWGLEDIFIENAMKDLLEIK